MYFYAEINVCRSLYTQEKTNGCPFKLKKAVENGQLFKYTMNELDFIKGHRNKQLHLPVQTKEELQNSIRKSSSNVLRWLIGVNFFELLLFMGLSLLLEDADNTGNHPVIDRIVNILDFIIYALPLIFSVFYLILIRRIRNRLSVSALLQNIFTACKLLNIYIYLNIAIFLIILYVAIFLTISTEHIYHETAGTMGTTASYVILISVCILVSLLFMFIVWLFYRLLYGRLRQKLNKNYEELKDME